MLEIKKDKVSFEKEDNEIFKAVTAELKTAMQETLEEFHETIEECNFKNHTIGVGENHIFIKNKKNDKRIFIIFDEIAKFEIGKTYQARSPGDHECIFKYTVIDRTPMKITLKGFGGKIKKRLVYVFHDSECCKPEGNYSLCPVLRADHESI